jgi:starch-binding outer membrane protein SusE/F
MKRKSFYRILAILVTATILFASCTKETADVRLDPTLDTTQSLGITSSTATVVGFVVAEGDGYNEKGVCYNTATAPTVANTKVAYTGQTKTATFNVTLTGLTFATKYYARAYATNATGTIYGQEQTFTTLPVVPTLTTAAVTAITSFTATGGGNATKDGGASITARGICYGLKTSPTIADGKTTDGTGLGAFTSSMKGLKHNTTYYVRAYATNSAGTAYGPEVTFKTAALPDAIYALGDGTAAGWDNTIAVKISQTTTPGIYEGILVLTAAKSMKFIQTLGAWQPQWGQATGQAAGVLGANLGGGSDPDAITTPATGGNYKVTVDLGAMTYKVVAAYPSALFMIGDGVGGWDWATLDLPMIPVNSHPNMFWKIVWMNATGGFKFAPQKEWKDDFGSTGSATAGVYAKGGDNIPVPGTAGYYMVVVDLTANKIAIADPKVYLIGDVIGSWDTANAAGLFTVDNANSVVTITKTLAAKELRMYAWHPWFTDWWQSEFIFLDGKIAFRGNGGDQSRVTLTAGSQTINLNFKTGAGAIQ